MAGKKEKLKKPKFLSEHFIEVEIPLSYLFVIENRYLQGISNRIVFSRPQYLELEPFNLL